MPSFEPPIEPPANKYANFVDDEMRDDSESAYLAMLKMCPDEKYSYEFTKIWAWALSQDDENAVVIGDKLGLDVKHAYAVLEWEKEYKERALKLYENSFDGDEYD